MDKKLIVFLGGGLALGGAFFAWYFLFGSDMVQREQARKPIAQWEAEWQRARRCLLGDAPKEADPTDTLAIRALDEIEIHCPLSELGRPEGQGSGIPEIEDAWGKIETAWHALAAAVPDPDKMGPQIRALDAADAQLRDGAKMPALDAPKPTRAITDLTLGPALASGADLSIDSPTRGHALYGGTGDARLALRAPVAATITHDQAGVVRAWPDASWGAAYSESGGDTSVAFGPIAADGSLGAGAEVVMRGQVVGVMAAIGGGAQREIVVRVLPAHPSDDYDTALAIVKTSDGGAHWSKPQPIAGAWDIGLSDSADEQPAILGHKDADTPAFLFFDKATGAPVPIVAAGTPDPARTCFSGALWYSVADVEAAIARAAPGDAAPSQPALVDDDPEMLACTKDAIAVRVHQKIHRCTPGACDDGLDVPNHIGFADVFDGSGVVFAAQAGRVVGVWRTGMAPVYDRAPAGAKLVGVAIWDKTPYLAFTTAAGVQVAPMK